jgi:hypothetical protein
MREGRRFVMPIVAVIFEVFEAQSPQRHQRLHPFSQAPSPLSTLVAIQHVHTPTSKRAHLPSSSFLPLDLDLRFLYHVYVHV